MPIKTKPINRLFSVAPMMAWTDRHCRYFHRLIAPDILLYSVMITSAALKYGVADKHLPYNQEEHPVALQLGGCDVDEMTLAAKIGEEWGYDEININCGCPSERVQKGAFGACLMAEPETVAACVKSMQAAVDIEVTVKTRIGIDEQDSYDFLTRFVEENAKAGCNSFTIHARKAWLKGLSPKENRNIPPLDYDRVYRLKQDYPELEIIINGGIKTIQDMQTHLNNGCDGVMVGREAYNTPWLLHDVQKTFFTAPKIDTKLGIAKAMTDYAARIINETKNDAHPVHMKDICRHLLGLYQNCAGAKQWRRTLSDHHLLGQQDAQLIYNAAQTVEETIAKRILIAD